MGSSTYTKSLLKGLASRVDAWVKKQMHSCTYHFASDTLNSAGTLAIGSTVAVGVGKGLAHSSNLNAVGAGGGRALSTRGESNGGGASNESKEDGGLHFEER